MPNVPRITSLQYFCNVPRKKEGANLIFCMHINIKFSHKLKLSILSCMASHFQTTQKIRKKGGMKLIFSHASIITSKIKNFCRLTLSFLMRFTSHAQSTHTSFYFCNISRKKLGMKFIFLYAGKN